MKPSLQAGLKHRFAYTVPETKTVPHLYRESPQLQACLLYTSPSPRDRS